MRIHEILASGAYPHWNPWNAVGAPLAVELPSIYTPFHWPLFAWPARGTWDGMLLSRFWVGGVGLLLLLRSLEVRVPIAFGFALLFSFNGHLLTFGNAWHVNTLVICPFFLLGLRDLLDRERWRRGIGVVAPACFLMVVGSGLLDLVLVIVLAGMVVALKLAASARDGTRQAIAGLVWFAVASSIGVGLSGIFLVPFLELRSLAVAPWEGRSAVEFDSLTYGLSLFFHKLTQTPPEASNFFMKGRQHLSILVLVGIALGALSFRAGTRDQRRWFLASLLFAGLYFGKLYGAPGLGIVEAVPFLREIRFEKYHGVPMLALYLVAALGVEWALRRRFWRTPGIEGAVGAGIALLPLAYFGATYGDSGPAAPAERLHALGYAGIAIGFCGAVAVWRRHPGRGAVTLLIAVFTLALWIDLRPGFLRTPTSFFPGGPAIDALHRQTTRGLPVRVFDATRNPPNRLLAYELHDVRYYSDSMLPRYRTVMRDLALRGDALNDVGLMASGYYDEFDHAVLSFLGVGYFIVPDGVEPVAGHRRTRSPSVFRNPGYFPRAYVVHRVRFGVPPEEILGEIAASPASFRARAWVEDARPAGFDPPVREPGSARVTRVEYGPNRVVLDVGSEDPGLLILMDQYYPGWRVSVNGEPREILRANYLYRGVTVDAGVSRVVFEYAPVSFRYGVALSGLSLAAWALAISRAPRSAGSSR